MDGRVNRNRPQSVHYPHQANGDIGEFSLFYSRALDPHSFFADPDPAFFLNADPDPQPWTLFFELVSSHCPIFLDCEFSLVHSF